MTRAARLARISRHAEKTTRAAVRRSQKAPLRFLRSLLRDTECAGDEPFPLAGCNPSRGKHMDDCFYGQLRDCIRALDGATKERT